MDLSGRYVSCSRVGHRGVIHVTEVQENGASICGLTDYGFGGGAHARVVNMYISQTLDTWVTDPEFTDVVSVLTPPWRDSYCLFYIMECLLKMEILYTHRISHLNPLATERFGTRERTV